MHYADSRCRQPTTLIVTLVIDARDAANADTSDANNTCSAQVVDVGRHPAKHMVIRIDSWCYNRNEPAAIAELPKVVAGLVVTANEDG